MKHKLLLGLFAGALAASLALPVHAQTYGAAYTTAITYQNLTESTASITFSFYSEASSSSIDVNATLAAHAAGSLNVGSVSSLSAGFHGSAVMSSNVAVAATLVQLPPSANTSKTRPLSDGFTTGSPVVLLASALKNRFNTNSIISVQNSDSEDNDFTVQFYAVGASTPLLIDITAQSIPPGATQYYDLGQITELGSIFDGSAVVYANKTASGDPGSAVATVLELNTVGKPASAFEGAAQGSTTVYMPSAMCQYSAALNTSNFAIQNTSSLNTANVTVTFNPGGIVQTVQIAPYSKASVNACGAGNAAGWLGAATITSDRPVIAIGKISGGGLSTAFVGASAGAARVALPYMRWASQTNYDNGTKQRAFITIQNVGATSTANAITVKYYSVTGALVSTHTIAAGLAAGAKATSNPNWANPSDTTYEFGYGSPIGGSAVVESTGAQLAVVVRTSSKLSATESAGEDYNGIPVTSSSTPYVPFVWK